MIPAPTRHLESRHIWRSEQPTLKEGERNTSIQMRMLGAISSEEGVSIATLGFARLLALQGLARMGYVANRSEYWWLTASGIRRAESEMERDGRGPVRKDGAHD